MIDKVWIGVIAIVLLIIAMAIGYEYETSEPANNPENKELIIKNAVYTTPAALYNQQVAPKTSIKLTGEVIQTGDGTWLRMKGLNVSYGINTDMHDIMVFGDFKNATMYEGNDITIYGTYYGPYTYETAMKSKRTVPCVTNAFLAE